MSITVTGTRGTVTGTIALTSNTVANGEVDLTFTTDATANRTAIISVSITACTDTTVANSNVCGGIGAAKFNVGNINAGASVFSGASADSIIKTGPGVAIKIPYCLISPTTLGVHYQITYHVDYVLYA